MAEITANMVKELRERTGAGMMECKKALVEANGNMEAAEEIIAKSGHKKAAKTASRTAADGRIVVATSPTAAVILEINSETDFVARDENFVQFCQQLAQKALSAQAKDVDALLTLAWEGGITVEDARKNLIARIGENIQIRRIETIEAKANQRIGSYVHGGRIGTLILLEQGTDEIAKDVAMHVAAMKPQYIAAADVPAEKVAKEKEILMEVAKQSGKPENILEKIVAGQLQKHLNELCLTGQPFFKDPEQSIGTLLNNAKASVQKMIRFEVGEGIEVVKKSFEEEVMSQARGTHS